MATYHHIICDAYCSLLVAELTEVYSGSAPSLPSSYLDYVRSDELAASPNGRPHAYWHERFPTLPAPMVEANVRRRDRHGRSIVC